MGWEVAAPIIASAVSGAIGTAGQQAANKMNYRIWREQRAWATGMRGTQYQAAVDDMRRAGLNPALMYGGGAGGAGTPSTGMPTMENELSSAASSAQQAVLQAAQVKLAKAQAEKAAHEAKSAEIKALMDEARKAVYKIERTKDGSVHIAGDGDKWNRLEREVEAMIRNMEFEGDAKQQNIRYMAPLLNIMEGKGSRDPREAIVRMLLMYFGKGR